MPSNIRSMSLTERLELYSMPEPNSGCQIWTKAVNAHGYGILVDGRINRGLLTALRGSMRTALSPDGLHVCHKCDLPPCIRLDHLFLGTDADNRADSVQKGRHAHGEKLGAAVRASNRIMQKGADRWSAVLDAEKILAIRASPESNAVLAARYGVQPPAISKIKLRQRWKHI